MVRFTSQGRRSGCLRAGLGRYRMALTTRSGLQGASVRSPPRRTPGLQALRKVFRPQPPQVRSSTFSQFPWQSLRSKAVS